MRITLGSFKYWHIKKALVFLCCMGISLAAIFMINNNSLNTGIIISGIILYDVIANLSFIKKFHYEAYIEDQGYIIYIKTYKKEYFIRKTDIKDAFLKEINYGGRWLDVIGYRLIVMADKKYIFDSVLLNKEKKQEKDKIEKLLKIFEV